MALAQALVRPIIDAHDLATIPTGRPDRTVVTTALGASLQPVTDGLLPGFAPSEVAAALSAFCELIGIISLEVFGHWRRTVLAPEVFFAASVESMARNLGVCP